MKRSTEDKGLFGIKLFDCILCIIGGLIFMCLDNPSFVIFVSAIMCIAGMINLAILLTKEQQR